VRAVRLAGFRAAADCMRDAATVVIAVDRAPFPPMLVPVLAIPVSVRPADATTGGRIPWNHACPTATAEG
jgi:hypothetical protein